MSDTVYYSVVETAQFIRRDLKEAFSGVKFSVRSQSYSMGAHVRVAWQDGPTEDEVKAVIGRYDGAAFDGMQDLKSSVYTTDAQGCRVHYGNDWTHLDRHQSLAFLAPIANAVAAQWGVASPILKARRCCDDKWDEVEWVDLERTLLDGQWDLRELTWREAQQTSAYTAPHRSATKKSAKTTTPATAPIIGPTIENYKGQPILGLPLTNKRTFRFGTRKAALIVEHLDTVLAFADGQAVPADLSTDYKSHTLLDLPLGSGSFKFGRAKAEAIAHYRDVVAHFAEHGTLPDTIPAPVASPATEPSRPAAPQVEAAARAGRFRELAENLQKQIDDKRGTSLKQMNPTRRRLDMIASMEQDARRLEVLQDKLRALAAAWDADSVPDSLRGITAKNQVEYLLRYSSPPTWSKRSQAAFKRMQRAGLIAPAAYARAYTDLERLGDPAAGQERPEDKIAALEREVRTFKIEGYFPTPPDVVERLLHLANILPGERVLEPSAGNGNIADAIRNAHPEVTLDVCEVSADLREILELKEHNLVAWDCLELAEPVYDTIVMNPPFELFQDIDHVRHAFDLLKSGGRVVAIMGEGVFFRSGRKPDAFRDWLNEYGWEAEQLPGGTFQSSGTGVASRIVVLEKPEAAPPSAPKVPEVQPEPVIAPVGPALVDPEPVSVPATFEPVAPTPEPAVVILPAAVEAAEAVPAQAQMELFTGREVLQFGLQKRHLIDVEALHNN